MSQVWQPKEYIDFQVQKLVGRYFLLCFQHPSWWWTAIFCWHFCWPQQYIGFRFHLPGPESFTWMLCLTSKSPPSANKPHHLPTRLPAFVPSSFPSLTVEILAPLWLLLTRFLSPGLSPFPSEPLPNPPFPFHFHCWVSSSSIRSFKGAFGTCDMPGHGADTRNPEKWSTVCAVREARWCPPRSNRITGIPRVCVGGCPDLGWKCCQLGFSKDCFPGKLMPHCGFDDEGEGRTDRTFAHGGVCPAHLILKTGILSSQLTRLTWQCLMSMSVSGFTIQRAHGLIRKMRSKITKSFTGIKTVKGHLDGPVG